jgi:enterobactin synthetase component D
MGRCSVSFDATSYDGSAAALGIALPHSLRSASVKRRAEFLAGRYCALQALRRAGWAGDTMVGIGPDDTPRWPTGMVGSITHTSEFASAAVAAGAELRSLGIDSEKIVSRELMREIDTRVLCGPRERRLRDLSVDLPPEEFVTLVFSAKESVFKCLYPVINFYVEFSDTEIVDVDVGAGEFGYRLTRDLAPGFPAGHAGRGRFEVVRPYLHTGVELAVV